MKKSLLLLAALACTGAIAQEKQIWACQGILDGNTGFLWKNGEWVNTLFNESNLLVTIDGSDSVIKHDGVDFPYVCTAISSTVGALVSCFSSSSFFLLNSESGHAGLSSLLGAADPDTEYRDSVHAALYECTKF